MSKKWLQYQVKENSSEEFPFPDAEKSPFLMLIAVRSEDSFPLFSQVFDSIFTVASTMELQEKCLKECESAWQCYLDILKNPYAPFPVEYQDALIANGKNDGDLRKKTREVLEKYHYICTFEELNLIRYWAQNNLHSLLQKNQEQILYVYEGVGYVDTANFLMKKEPVGYVKILKTAKKAEALYSSSYSFEKTFSCTYEEGVLTIPSPDAYSLHVVYNFMLENHPFPFCFMGTKVENGKKRTVIAQPTENPDLPWWIVLYDLTYTAYYIVQIGMGLDMLYHLLKGLKQGLEFLSKNAEKLFQSLHSRLSQIGKEANPYSDLEELPEELDIDPVNIDADIDTEIDTVVDTVEDTVVDTEIDTITDIDTVIDVDIIVDVPFDFTDVVIDVDTVIDIDTVVDTVEDTVVDTEINTEIDTVIDTSIESIAEGTVTTLLKKVGKWIVTKGWKVLLKNVAIIVAFQAVDKLLAFWKKHAQKELDQITPQEVTGLGLLTNYMLNEKNPVKERWTTFGDFVEELNSYPDEDQNGWKNSQEMQKITLTMVLSTGKEERSKIGWSKKDRDPLVEKMLQYHIPSDQHRAYKEVLATYQFAEKDLPVTAGASVAKSYLSKITT